MDHSDPAIEFDENGICNHCHRYDELVSGRTVSSENQSHELKKLIKKIKASGRKKEYDCLIGVSGGVDSSYLAYLSKECGLRPLAVHVDNGWNSELATNNIHNLLKKLNIDLHTHVIDWNEFKNLQLSFLPWFQMVKFPQIMQSMPHYGFVRINLKLSIFYQV